MGEGEGEERGRERGRERETERETERERGRELEERRIFFTAIKFCQTTNHL